MSKIVTDDLFLVFLWSFKKHIYYSLADVIISVRFFYLKPLNKQISKGLGNKR